ncbi:MAG: hypothetical protein ABUL63_02830 [Acidobacteriota bacterium]
MPSQRTRTTVLLATGLALAACASTSIVESWKAPEAAGPLRFNKVLALAVLDNESTRSRAEDALQANLPNVQAVQSYKIFTIAELEDLTGLKERLRQDGFDGVVVLSLAGAEQKVGWTSTNDPWAEEYAWYPTEQMAVDTIVRVEIKIYSLTEDKLIWGGLSQSFNPKDTENLVSEIAAAAGKELRRQGLIST